MCTESRTKTENPDHSKLLDKLGQIFDCVSQLGFGVLYGIDREGLHVAINKPVHGKFNDLGNASERGDVLVSAVRFAEVEDSIDSTARAIAALCLPLGAEPSASPDTEHAWVMGLVVHYLEQYARAYEAAMGIPVEDVPARTRAFKAAFEMRDVARRNAKSIGIDGEAFRELMSKHASLCLSGVPAARREARMAELRSLVLQDVRTLSEAKTEAQGLRRSELWIQSTGYGCRARELAVRMGLSAEDLEAIYRETRGHTAAGGPPECESPAPGSEDQAGTADPVETMRLLSIEVKRMTEGLESAIRALVTGLAGKPESAISAH